MDWSNCEGNKVGFAAVFLNIFGKEVQINISNKNNFFLVVLVKDWIYNKITQKLKNSSQYSNRTSLLKSKNN